MTIFEQLFEELATRLSKVELDELTQMSSFTGADWLVQGTITIPTPDQEEKGDYYPMLEDVLRFTRNEQDMLKISILPKLDANGEEVQSDPSVTTLSFKHLSENACVSDFVDIDEIPGVLRVKAFCFIEGEGNNMLMRSIVVFKDDEDQFTFGGWFCKKN